MSAAEALFIVALVATGGVVAWIGDIVGYRLGKRRVSLFGIRPRTTAILVGIASGAFISIVTIVVLSLTSRHVKTALIGMDELSEKLETLQRQTEQQKQQIEEHKRAAAEAERRRAAAESRESQAMARVAALETDIRKRQAQLGRLRVGLAGVRKLQQQTEAKNEQLEVKALDLADKIREAQRGLETAQILLARQRAILVRVATGLELAHYEDPVIEAREECARGVIDAARPTPEVRSAVVALLQEASAYAAERGAATGENERAVIYVALGLDETAEAEVLPEPQAIDQFVATVLERQHKSLAVRVIARLNAWRGEQVAVVLEDQPNMLVFMKDEVAGDIAVDSSWADVQLYQAITALLTIEVRSEARRRRMLTVPNDKKYGSIKIPEVFAAMDEIRTRKGIVTIEAVVAQDTWTSGPLELDLRLAAADPDERLGRLPDDSPRAGS